jgi:hypothetical protein
LLRDICAENRFCAGDISTKYLPEVYPDGFKGTQLGSDEQLHLVAVAASLQAHKEARAHCFTNDKRRETQADPYDVPFEFICQVCVLDLFLVGDFSFCSWPTPTKPITLSISQYQAVSSTAHRMRQR